MNDRDALTLTSRERMRQEIEQQVASFLNSGGHIEYVHTPSVSARPIGPVWWDSRGSGLLMHG